MVLPIGEKSTILTNRWGSSMLLVLTLQGEYLMAILPLPSNWSVFRDCGLVYFLLF